MQSTFILTVKKNISPKNKRECDQEIIVAEIEKAIKSFENNKSPSNEGLPAEFYKTFNEILKTDLHKLYNEIYQLGEMPRSGRQCWRNAEKCGRQCLFKKEDREDTTN